jgi:glycine betaine/proline transport system ATP-binding protein
VAVIEIRHVSKLFGPTPRKGLALVRNGVDKDTLLAETRNVLALDDVSLSVERGETFVVMGLSGSGKSTLLRHINRLIDPTEGEIVVDGVDVLGLSIRDLEQFRRKKMAMVFQHFGLFPHRTVIDNVAYGLEVRGVAKAARRAKAGEWVATVGLAGYEERYPSALSGGMRQRVGLARALCADAEILLMDEAFSALDPLIRSEMQEQLSGLQGRLRKTIVFITHDLDEALRLGDRIAILKDGRVGQVGTPAEIVGNPADDYVRAFVAAVNRPRTAIV